MSYACVSFGTHSLRGLRFMLWYVALVAAVNLGLGYLWGAYLRPCPRCAKARALGLSLLTPTSVGEALPRDTPVAPAVPPPRPAAAPAPPAVAAVDAADSPPIDPTTGLATREHAEQLLSERAAIDADAPAFTAALVEIAPIDWDGKSPDAALAQRLLCGVSNLVRQSLETDHTAARFNDQQLLLLVPHEDVQQATRRAEQLRQRVAATEFVADDQTLLTTVTCALAEVSGDRVGPRLFEYLQEALDEAKRYGGNRTFMHDGKSPTPVVPAELPIAAEQLAI